MVVFENTLSTTSPNLTTNNIDPDGTTTTVTTILSSTAGGTTIITGGGTTIDYTPLQNYVGIDTVIYTVCDAGLPLPAICLNDTLFITVSPITDTIPFTIPEDSTITICADSLTDFGTAATSITTCNTPNNGTILISGTCITYTPNANFNGIDSLCVVSCNGLICDTSIVIINVTPINDPPIVNDTLTTTPEDSPITICLTIADADLSQTYITSSCGNPINGTTSTSVTGNQLCVTYTPNPNFNGLDSLCLVVCDNGTPSLCDTTNIVINVTPVNDAPVITDVNTTVAAGTIVPINVAAGTSDPDGDALTYTYGASTGVPVVVTVTGNGTIVVAPVNPTDTGLVVIPVTVCDNGTPVLCDNGTITIHFVPDSVLTNTNFAPIAVNDLASTNPNTPVTVNIKGNDSDPNGNNTIGTPTIFINPTNGVAVINPDGTLTYTPNNGFTGNDTLTYVVCDNGTPSLCDTALVVVSVINGVIPNQPPVATDDYPSVTEDVPVVIGVKNNDSDPDGNVLGNPTIITNPTNGTAVVNGDGTVTYTPNPNYNGPDTLTYVVCDNGTPSLCDTAVVVINVTPANDAPVITDVTTTVAAGTIVPVNIAAGTSDPDGDALTYTYGASTGVPVVVTVTGNGTIVVNPVNPSDTGLVVIPVTVCDNGSPVLCDNGTITIHFVPDSVLANTNFAPIAVNDLASTNPNTPVTVNIKGNDSDPNGNNTLGTPSIFINPTNGTASINPDGTLTYTPNNGFTGNDTLTYVVCDNGTPSLCDTALVVVSVINGVIPNQPPVATDDYPTTTEDVPVVIGVKNNDSDPDGNVLGNPTIITNPTNGTAVVNIDGTITYTPNPNFHGNDTLVYVVCDNGTPSLCDTANVIITIDPANDAPVITDVTTTVAAGTTVPVNIAAGTSDPNGDLLTYTYGASTGVPVVVTVTGNGTIVVTPVNATDTGLVVIPVTVCDNGTPVLCDNGTITIHFVPDSVLVNTNFPPVALNDLTNTNPNTPVTVNIKGNDSDPNGNNTIGAPSIFINPTNGAAVINPDGTLTYTPNNGFIGNDTLTYIICDNGTPSLCDTAIVVVSVTETVIVNHPPVATDDYPTVTEDTPTIVIVKSNDSDPDGNVLGNPTIITNPANGTAVVNIDGTITYTPNPNFNGIDTLTYVICDNGIPSLCDTANVIININSINDEPIINDTTVVTPQGTPITVCLPISDLDAGQTYFYSSCGNPVNGTVTSTIVGNTVCLTYTPNNGYTGLDSMCVVVCDNGSPSLCDTATIVVNVTPGPVVVNENVGGTTGSPITGNILTNDSPVGATIGSTVDNPNNGTITITPGTGGFTYTPNPGFSGYDTVIVEVCSNSICVNDTIFITVNPDINNETITVTSGTSSTGTIGTNDNGTGLTYGTTPVSGPNHGTITIGATGTYTYTPTNGYTGPDTVVVTVCDSSVPPLCSTDTIFVNIIDGPTVVNENVGGTTGSPITGNILTNDSPVGATIGSTVDNPNNGTITITPGTGGFTYTPNPGFSGYDTVIVQVCANSACINDTIFITVNPDINNETITVTSSTSSTGTIGTNDNGTGLTYGTTPVSGPNHGTITVGPTGTYTYTPNNGYTGPDTVIVAVCDASTPALCTTDTIFINVITGPIVTNENAGGVTGTPITGNVLTNDGPTGSTLGNIVDTPHNGTAVVNPNGGFTYTPNTGFSGRDTVVVEVCFNGACVNDTIFITVYPNIIDESISVNAGSTTTGSIGTNDSGTGLTYGTTPVTGPTNGTIVLNTNGTYTYTANSGYTGFDTVVVTVCDASVPALCSTDTIFITINEVVTGIVIPKGFSPNGDGINDNLEIKGIENFPDNNMKIFNRWGSIIYEADHYDNTSVKWEGTSTGKMVIGDEKAPEATYFYILVYKDAKGEEQKMVGYIYLNRNGQ
jgi:gliding motility-associated-like protein